MVTSEADYQKGSGVIVQSKVLKIPIVSVDFVTACLEECALLDHSKFQLNA